MIDPKLLQFVPLAVAIFEVALTTAFLIYVLRAGRSLAAFYWANLLWALLGFIVGGAVVLRYGWLSIRSEDALGKLFTALLLGVPFPMVATLGLFAWFRPDLWRRLILLRDAAYARHRHHSPPSPDGTPPA